MIVITGGDGEFGRLVAGHLLDHLPAGQVAVTVREPRKAGAAEGPRRGRGHADFDELATLVRAFKGADTVLINGTNYGTDPARRAQQHAAAITAAAVREQSRCRRAGRCPARGSAAGIASFSFTLQVIVILVKRAARRPLLRSAAERGAPAAFPGGVGHGGDLYGRFG